MRMNPKPTNKIRLEYNKLIGVEGQECLTYGEAPSSDHVALKGVVDHHSL